MIRYFDTSFVAPLIREETKSAAVMRFVAGMPARELATSRWTEVEIASLLARDVRMGVLTSLAAHEADARFGEIVRGAFVVFSPAGGDFDLARRFLHAHETGLRAGDALHLAIAANHRAGVIHTFDKTMIRAGERLGLPVAGGS